MASTSVTPRSDPTDITPRGSRTDNPVSVTPRRRIPLTPVNSQPRKQYRISKRIPRQTLHNRKRRKLSASGVDSVDDPETPDQNAITTEDHLQHQDDNPPDPRDVAAPNLSLSSLSHNSSEENLGLFFGSTISVHTSIRRASCV